MNKEIKQLIENEAREYAFQQYKDDEFTETILFNETINDFKAGANFILSKWQEANRWRKVSEELPKVKNEHYFINIKRSDSDIRIETLTVFSEMEDVKGYLEFNNVTEWKPIE